MRVKVRKVGNSLTVTIPKEIAMDLGLGPDVEMDVSAREGTLVLQPVTSRWDRLVAEVRIQPADRGLTEQDIDRAVAEARGHDA
jgi:antitoxin component of MazEF toxin-antitoxin module